MESDEEKLERLKAATAAARAVQQDASAAEARNHVEWKAYLKRRDEELSALTRAKDEATRALAAAVAEEHEVLLRILAAREAARVEAERLAQEAAAKEAQAARAERKKKA